MASGISAVSGGGAGGVSFDSEGNISIPGEPALDTVDWVDVGRPFTQEAIEARAADFPITVYSGTTPEVKSEKGGFFSGIGGFLTGKVDDFKSNPVKSVAGALAPSLVGLAVPQLAGFLAAAKAAGVLGLIANDIMYDRSPGIMEADFMADPRGGSVPKGIPDAFIDSPALGTYNSGLPAATYAQEQADYDTEGRASLDSPYIRPAATATQSQSSIPPAANPYSSSPNQYNVGGLDIQYPTRNSQNIIAPTDYRTAAATPLDYANVIASPGTPYYRNMAAGGYVDRPLYPSPRITGR